MKKLKIGFGEGGFQGFMARHVEKCVLAVVTAVMAWFIYSGTGAKALEGNITKEGLQKNASEADSKITNSKWETVAKDRDPKQDVDGIIVNQKAKVDARFYANRAWDVPLVPRMTPRFDPKILPPEKLMAFAFEGPLVVIPPDSETEVKDPLDKFKVVLGSSGYGGGYGGYGMSKGTEDEEEPDSKSKPKRPAREPREPKNTKGGPPTVGGSAAILGKGKSKKGDDPYDAPMASSATSMNSAKQGRSIPPEATPGVKATQGSVLQAKAAMVINAVVPFSKQWEEYREAFKDAPGGQDPERDTPHYIAVWVEVLDVTDDPGVDPATAAGWRRIKGKQLTELANLEKDYGAEVMEIADPEAIDEALTHKVPPFLLTNLQPALLHPDVPKAADVVEENVLEEEMEAIETDEGTILKEAESGGAGGSGYGRYASKGGNQMRSPGPQPRGAGRNSPAPRGYPAPGAGRGRTQAPTAGYGNKAPTSRPGMSYGGSGGINFETYRPIAKKLVRFVDYNVEPGHKYRYRMQVVVSDPNRPEDPETAPDITTLDEKARERVKALDSAEKAAKAATRKYWRTSPPSEPSDIVSIPNSEWFYAGATTAASKTTLPSNVEVKTGEPTATVLTVKFDPVLGVFAPAEQTAHRGSVLDFKGDVEVLHPVMGDLRKVPDYQLRTEGIVLDIMGGEKLPGGADAKEPERAPGETLIMDAAGNLVVTDEAHDVEGYRRYIFPEPKEPAPSKETAGSGSMEMEPPTPYPSGYPTSKGGKPSKSPPGPMPPGSSKGGYPSYPKSGKPGK